MRAGTAMLVGDGTKETNLIYVENLCRAISLSIMNEVAFGQVYNLTDGELVTKRQLFDVVCDGLGIPRVRISIPMWLARTLVNFSSAVALAAPPKLKTRLALFSRPALRLVGLNQGFDISKAERELGYTSRISFAEGMARTLRSYAAGDRTMHSAAVHMEHTGALTVTIRESSRATARR
jgi:nucleoside-diphosphate-sugar epimerase